MNYRKMRDPKKVQGLDCESLANKVVLMAARESNGIMTIEEHSIIGGLGSAVAEVLAEVGSLNITFKRLGIPDIFCSQVGGQEYLRRVYGLGSGAICRAALELLHSYRR